MFYHISSSDVLPSKSDEPMYGVCETYREFLICSNNAQTNCQLI